MGEKEDWLLFQVVWRGSLPPFRPSLTLGEVGKWKEEVHVVWLLEAANSFSPDPLQLLRIYTHSCDFCGGFA